MPGRIPIKILAKIVVGVEHARYAIRRLFAKRISVAEHLAILREVLDGADRRHAREKGEADAAFDCCNVERVALSEEVESLKAAVKNLQANAVYYQDDNTALRAVIADAEGVLRDRRPLHQKKAT
jgi:hypothetical protein